MKEFLEGYFITKEGQVISHHRKKEIKPEVNHKGYLRVKINKKWFRVHRLVAEAFIPNSENKPCVNHINGIRDDNRVENLEWADYSENNIHAYRKLDRKVSGNCNPRVPVVAYNPETRKIKRFKAINGVVYEGFTPSSVNRCIRGKQKQHKGWQFYTKADYEALFE